MIMPCQPRRNLPAAIDLPPEAHLETRALADPAQIDAVLEPFLVSSNAGQLRNPGALALYLDGLISDETKQCVTPPIYWADPSRSTDSGFARYRDPILPSAELSWIRVHSTLLGRAFSLSYSKRSEEVKPAEKEEFEELWQVIQSVFMRALFAAGNNRDADTGARYAAGILILTCSQTLAADGGVRGRGKQWTWYNNAPIQPNEEWGWSDLCKAVFETKNLPRDNTNFHQLLTHFTEQMQAGVKIEPPEFVQQEVLDVWDMARKHLSQDRADLSSEELSYRFQ